jgi:alpha-1,3-rhamnosyl/mannosyltransferase
MHASKKPSTHYNRIVGFDATPLLRKTDGIGRYTQSLINAYAEAFPANKIYLIGFLDDNISTIALLKRHLNIEFVKVPIPRRPYSILYSRVIRFDLRRFVPHLDIFVGTNFVAFPYISQTPKLSIVHDLAYIRYPDTIEKGNLRYLTKHVARSMHEHPTAGVSEFTAREMSKELGVKKRPYVVPNGIDISIWRADSTPKTHQKYILTVGTREPRKNQAALIEAYLQLPASVRKKYELVIVGKKGWGNEVESASQEGVHYTGYLEDNELAKLYQGASLFVFPSLYEGFGLPLLEAMAADIPIAAADIEPFREIAADTIAYFEPTNKQSIKDTLLSCLEKPPKLNYDTILKEYAWKQSALRLNDALNDILDK